MYDYSHFKSDNFISDFSNLNWTMLYNPRPSTSDKFDLFYQQVSSITAQHVPKRKLSKKEIKLKIKPWITPAILKKIKYQDKLYSQILKNNNPSNDLVCLFKTFRNRVVSDTV